MEKRADREESFILAASERERLIISEELHEGLCQNLAAASIAVGLLLRQTERGKPLKAANLKELTELVNRANAEARSYIRQLKPAELESEGLMKGLDQLAETTAKSIPCEFVCEKIIYVREPERALGAYRICQEAVRNALKHSQATQITITLRENASVVRAEIRDNGCGFVPQSPDAQMRGMTFMRALAAIAQAELEINSRPGAGTAITCVLPTQLRPAESRKGRRPVDFARTRAR